MAMHPLSDVTLRQSLAFYDKARGSIVRAAALAGTNPSTFKHRLMLARTKFGMLPPEHTVDKTVEKRASEAEELKCLRKEVVILRQHIAAKAANPPPKPAEAKPRPNRSKLRVIIPDSHGSHIDPQARAAFLADLARLDPDEIVGLGDHIDCGGFLAAHHTNNYVAQLDEGDYEADLSAWGSFLDDIQKAAPRAKLHILEGNHEQRLERWAVDQALGNGKNAEFLLRAVGPVHRLDYKGRGITYVRYGETQPGMRARGVLRLGKCFYTHGFSTGRGAAANHIRKIGGCVVYGHTHTPAAHFTRTVKDGEMGAWNFGTLAKLAPRYMHNNPDEWGHGYGVQEVSASGLFTTIHVPIVGGVSLLPTLHT